MQVDPHVLSAIQERLDVPRLVLRPLNGGTNDRTFVAEYQENRWVIRVEPADGVQLRRAYTAQLLALAAGVATPQIVAAHLDVLEGEPFQWVIETYIQGDQFFPLQFEPVERNALAFDL